MKSFDLKLDIKRLMELTGLSVEDFAEGTNVSRQTIINILDDSIEPSIETLEKIYSFAYGRHINLNRSKELLYKDDEKVLFHGARGEIIGEIDNKHSNPPNDFGDGFYTGETLNQAASWISNYNSGSVYCFQLKDFDDLKILRFATDASWLYTVLYFRGAFKDFEIDKEIMDLINKVKDTDLIVAPIADNEMFKTIDAFARNEITNEACLHALNASNLGMQYVFKSDLACSRLKFIDRLYLCKKERNDYIIEKEKLSKDGIEKAHLAIIEYRRKGEYFDEIFKRKG